MSLSLQERCIFSDVSMTSRKGTAISLILHAVSFFTCIENFNFHPKNIAGNLVLDLSLTLTKLLTSKKLVGRSSSLPTQSDQNIYESCNDQCQDDPGSQFTSHLVWQNFYFTVFSDTITVINITLCMIVLQFHYTLAAYTSFDDLDCISSHSSIKQFSLKILCYDPVQLN